MKKWKWDWQQIVQKQNNLGWKWKWTLNHLSIWYFFFFISPSSTSPIPIRLGRQRQQIHLIIICLFFLFFHHFIGLGWNSNWPLGYFANLDQASRSSEIVWVKRFLQDRANLKSFCSDAGCFFPRKVFAGFWPKVILRWGLSWNCDAPWCTFASSYFLLDITNAITALTHFCNWSFSWMDRLFFLTRTGSRR